MFNKIIILFVILSLASQISANTGAAFLKINTSARAASLGGAYTGVGNDVSAINYNPAALSLLEKKELTAQHTEWVTDINHDFLALAMPLNRSDSTESVGMSIVFLTQGKLEGRDENRQKTSTFEASDLAVTLSYAGKFNTSIRWGAGAKLIRQNIADESAGGAAFDLGMLYQPPIQNTMVGFSLLNIGPPMKFIDQRYKLPLTMAVGVGYNLLKTLTFALDIKSNIYDKKTDVSFGTEYFPLNILSVRLGYIETKKYELSDHKAILSPNLSGGFGLKILNFTTDYAFVPFGDLGNTHKLSFSVKF